MLGRILSVVVVGILLGACAIGNTHRYDLGDATFAIDSDKTVAVTVVDLRPYVMSADKTPDFTGLMRGGFGNPFDVTTEGGRPLADDMTTSIVESLRVSNVDAFAAPVPPMIELTAAREQLLSTEADRFVLVQMREWKSDTYVNTGLTYDLTLEVLQRDGAVLAEKALRGDDNLGASLVPADARMNAERAFRQMLEELFGDPGVVSALQ